MKEGSSMIEGSTKLKAFLGLAVAVIFTSLAKCVLTGMKCSPPIEDNHLKYLDEMIDAQLNTSCSVNMKVIDSEQLDDYCYKRGVISQLSVLMERLEFKPYSQSYNYTKILNNVYNQRFKDCIDEIEHITQEDISPCSRYIDLSPSQNLERVKMSFVIFRDFKANSESEVKCFKKYRECKDDHLTKAQHQDRRQNSNLFLVMIPSILAIIFLSGLLYFMYHYRLHGAKENGHHHHRHHYHNCCCLTYSDMSKGSWAQRPEGVGPILNILCSVSSSMKDWRCHSLGQKRWQGWTTGMTLMLGNHVSSILLHYLITSVN
ncbi:macrophage colony-stimulating factor 1 isoform X3 [Pyxicephalus adspersus]|uniref:macrophage colony-stimulating factor 1 isoform X3 n=1 Tax=Pyxicephalus adspersus TaxID=30357 RepID=UPI003B5AF8BE